MGVNSLPKIVTRQRRDCDLNPGPSVTESSTLTTRLPRSHLISCISLGYSYYNGVSRYSVTSAHRCEMGPNSISSICCGFAVRRTDATTMVVDTVKYTTNVQQDNPQHFGSGGAKQPDQKYFATNKHKK